MPKNKDKFFDVDKEMKWYKADRTDKKQFFDRLKKLKQNEKSNRLLRPGNKS